MEYKGQIWFVGDDPSSAVAATVELPSDERILVRIGDAPAMVWYLDDVIGLADHPVTTITVDEDTVNFEPDDHEAWKAAVAEAQMRVRLQGATGQTNHLATTPGAGIVRGSFCRACGEPIDPRAEVCVNCGVRQYALTVRPYKSKTTAGLLALFLGGFGAHHFYLGRTGLGMLYLLFFWTLIPGFIAFFEALVYFFQSDASFNAKYNS